MRHFDLIAIGGGSFGGRMSGSLARKKRTRGTARESESTSLVLPPGTTPSLTINLKRRDTVGECRRQQRIAGCELIRSRCQRRVCWDDEGQQRSQFISQARSGWNAPLPAQPSLIGTSRTGKVDFRITLWATEPINNSPSADRPWAPITMRSALTRLASCRMLCAANPSTIRISAIRVSAPA